MKTMLYFFLNSILGVFGFAIIVVTIGLARNIVGLTILIVIYGIIIYKISFTESTKCPKHFWLWGISFIWPFLLFSVLINEVGFTVILLVVSGILYIISLVGAILGKRLFITK